MHYPNGTSGLYQTQSPVLFIIFNRPDTTRQVFEQIRNARPARLYVAADGPRPNKAAEKELCLQTREIINEVDWDCQVFTLLRDDNWGCKNAVSSAVSWFFEQEEEGIILEDDCLPDNSFFSFCDAMLARYRHDTRIRHISGCNLQHGVRRGNASYYFSNLTHIWGWASWRYVWQDYNKELAQFSSAEAAKQLPKIFDDPFVIKSWLQVFNDLKAGKIDTWDYQLVFLNFFNHSLSIIPNKNLITNIGFGESATHTVNGGSAFANIPLQSIGELTHPIYILPEQDADHYTLIYAFGIEQQRKKYYSTKQRFKRFMKGVKK